MNRLQKMVVVGAFGGLATATAAASGAFACTELANLKVLDNKDNVLNPVTVAPGQTIRVRGHSFVPGKPVTLQWYGANKQVVNPEVLTDTGPSFTMDHVQVPTNVRTGDYDLVARSEQWSTLVRISVIERNQPPGQPGPVTGPGEVLPSDPQVAPTQTPAPAPAPSGVRAPAAQQVPAAAPAAAATGGTVSEPARSTAAPASAPAPAGAAVAEQLPIVDPVAEPAAADLWSGVSGEGTSGLLDSSGVPTPENGTPPAGVVLLGLGALALAGTAAVAGRRQVAVRRASR